MTAALLRRSVRVELRLAAVVLTVAAAAWVLTAHRMAGMDAGPGTDLGGVGWFAISWLVMMAAMMLPALTPMAVLAVLVAAERLLPRPARLGVALVLVALGTAVALAPGQVPALTIPSSQSVGMMPMHRQS